MNIWRLGWCKVTKNCDCLHYLEILFFTWRIDCCRFDVISPAGLNKRTWPDPKESGLILPHNFILTCDGRHILNMLFDYLTCPCFLKQAHLCFSDPLSTSGVLFTPWNENPNTNQTQTWPFMISDLIHPQSLSKCGIPEWWRHWDSVDHQVGFKYIRLCYLDQNNIPLYSVTHSKQFLFLLL